MARGDFPLPLLSPPGPAASWESGAAGSALWAPEEAFPDSRDGGGGNVDPPSSSFSRRGRFKRIRRAGPGRLQPPPPTAPAQSPTFFPHMPPSLPLPLDGWVAARRQARFFPIFSHPFYSHLVRRPCLGGRREGREAIRAEEEEEEEASLPTGAGGDDDEGETLALDEGGGCGGGALSSSSSMEEESLSLSFPPSVRPCCPPSSPFSPLLPLLVPSSACVASRLPRGALTLNCASVRRRPTVTR